MGNLWKVMCVADKNIFYILNINYHELTAHQYNPVLRASKTEKRWRVLRVTRIFVFILSGATIESKSETYIELQLKTRIHDVHFVLS